MYRDNFGINRSTTNNLTSVYTLTIANTLGQGFRSLG